MTIPRLRRRCTGSAWVHHVDKGNDGGPPRAKCLRGCARYAHRRRWQQSLDAPRTLLNRLRDGLEDLSVGKRKPTQGSSLVCLEFPARPRKKRETRTKRSISHTRIGARFACEGVAEIDRIGRAKEELTRSLLSLSLLEAVTRLRGKRKGNPMPR